MVAEKDSAAAPPVADVTKRGFALRRDRSGHVNPKFAADLRGRIRKEKTGKEDAGPVTALPGLERDPAAQLAGRQFVKTATSGEDESLDAVDVGTGPDHSPGKAAKA